MSVDESAFIAGQVLERIEMKGGGNGDGQFFIALENPAGQIGPLSTGILNHAIPRSGFLTCPHTAIANPTMHVLWIGMGTPGMSKYDILFLMLSLQEPFPSSPVFDIKTTSMHC